MRMKYFMSVLVTATLLLGSCTTPKDVAYFPDLNTGSIVRTEKVLDIRVKPEDKLSITVNAQDPSLSSLFNLVTSQNRLGRGSSSSARESDTNTGEISYYTVDSAGDINFPVLGKIHIAGLTREEVANKIAQDLMKADLVKDPIVIVEFANTGIAGVSYPHLRAHER